MSVSTKKLVTQGQYPFIKDREEALDKAIAFIKKCPYKGTAIKIELEALLSREGQTRQCAACNYGGEVVCPDCNGTILECLPCNSRGYVACQSCNGRGNIPAAPNQLSISACNQLILENVSDKAREALIFSTCYRDGSVDTEFTFTLPLDKARYAIEFIRAFSKLSEHVGAPMNVDGAGMHIAILNEPNGNYPRGNRLDSRRAQNFKSSMTKMLPALFFLASSDYRSRRLNYRGPAITLSDKYGCISGSSNCFEYRVFETCYQRPEAIIDNICVIANTLKYYSYRKVTHSFFGTIGKVGFQDFGQGIQRFFNTENNYKALMAGVSMLKPSYKTIADLRRERNFKLTLTKILSKEKVKESLWRGEYRNLVKENENQQANRIAQFKKEYKDYLRRPRNWGFESKAMILRDWATVEDYIKYKNRSHPKLSEKKFLDEKKEMERGFITETITI